MSMGDALAKSDRRSCVALDVLEDIIKYRACKSHQELFEVCSLEQAHFLSQTDTEALKKEGYDTRSLVYGEIDFWPFYDVIKAAAEGMDVTEKGLKFYDLGSGSGKALFAAVLAVDFRYAVGIEILAGVHRASTCVFKHYRRLVEPVLCSPALIRLYHGSFLSPDIDWTDGDVLFANSTCFEEGTMSAIAERAASLRDGARIVTFTTALKTPWLRVLLKRRYQMTWGPATVFVHQKLSSEEYVQRSTERTAFAQDQEPCRLNGYSAPRLVGGAAEVDLVSSGSSVTIPSMRKRHKGEGAAFNFEGQKKDGNQEADEGLEGHSAPRRPSYC